MTFAEALKDAMTARGVTCPELAAALGCSLGPIYVWRSGKVMPDMYLADAAADYLDAPEVRRAALAFQSGRCRRCRKRFLRSSKGRARIYCSRSCKDSVAQGRALTRSAEAKGHRLAKLERSVAAHCRECEPSGVCRDETCQLRGVSPFPLMTVTRKSA